MSADTDLTRAVRVAVEAERERCAQLAEQVGATYVHYGTDLDPIRTRKPFAALLREQP